MEIEKGRYTYRQGRSKSRLKRIVAAVLAVIILGAASTYTSFALVEPIPAVAAEKNQNIVPKPEIINDISWPATGQAAFGTVSDGVLASSSSDGNPRPIASMTKVITALMIIEKSGLKENEKGKTRTFDASDEASYRSYLARQGSVVPTNSGGQVTDLQALQALLIVSANNIADSLVRWHFGSTQAYLAYANDRLDEMGLEATTVADASGFSPNSVSTPADMVVLGSKLLEEPVLSQIVTQNSINWPGWGEIKNTNQLLTDGDALGIKTGNTDEAGSCLLFAYKFGPDKSEKFVGVVMGQPNYYGMFATARTLKDSALPHFRTIEILPEGTAVGKLTSPWGNTTDVITNKPIKVYGWVGKQYEVNVSIGEAKAPVARGQIIGEASSGETKVTLSAQSSLGGPGIVWKLTNFL